MGKRLYSLPTPTNRSRCYSIQIGINSNFYFRYRSLHRLHNTSFLRFAEAASVFAGFALGAFALVTGGFFALFFFPPRRFFAFLFGF